MREIKEQFEGSIDQYGRTYKCLDFSQYYTTLTARILSSPHGDTYSGDPAHDAVIKKINLIKLGFKGAKNADELLESEFSKILGGVHEKNIDEDKNTNEEDKKNENQQPKPHELIPTFSSGLGERIFQKYLYADEIGHTGNMISNYVKYSPVKEKSLYETLDDNYNMDFDLIGAELAQNFIRTTYEKIFINESNFMRFLGEYATYSWEQLEEILEEYVESKKSDYDIMPYKGIHNVEDIENRSAYFIASVMLWKSTHIEQLERSIEAIHAMELVLKDEFSGYKTLHIIDEFQTGAENYFDDYLWLHTCNIAGACIEDIEETITSLSDEEETHHEDLILWEFLRRIVSFLSPATSKEGLEAYEKLKEYYTIACQQSDDATGDFDHDD